MFTGLVEEIGHIESIQRQGTGLSLWVATKRIGVDSANGGAVGVDSANGRAVAVGDSIAVSGVCLTVEELRGRSFRCHAGTETVALTTLATMRPAQAVNLERALSASSRLGGHFVQGHVDGLGKCAARVQEGETTRFGFEAPAALTPYIAPKGSIAIDGISLTVTAIEGNVLAVAIIPQTLANTTLGDLQPGAEVNLEVDIIAKYVARMLGLAGQGTAAGDGQLAAKDFRPTRVTREFLEEHGF